MRNNQLEESIEFTITDFALGISNVFGDLEEKLERDIRGRHSGDGVDVFGGGVGVFGVFGGGVVVGWCRVAERMLLTRRVGTNEAGELRVQPWLVNPTHTLVRFIRS
jgi:hypothetical protein